MSNKRIRKVSLPPLPTGLMPTPEQQRRCEYEIRRIEKNGPKVAVNTNGSPLARLDRNRVITKTQREAGEKFEAARQAVFGGSGTNSVAALMELGVRVQGGGTEGHLAAKQWAEARVDEVRQRCAPAAYDLLIDVACLGRHPRKGCAVDYRRIREALDACVDVFGLPVAGIVSKKGVDNNIC